jgi:hypothetical protein
MRVSPPPVIVPVRGPFPWAAVLAAAIAGSAVTGVIGYRIGLGQRPATVAEMAAAPTSATPAQPPPGTDVTVPPPLAAPPPVSAAQSGAPASSPSPSWTSASAARTPSRPAPAARPRPEKADKANGFSGSLLVETRPAGARVVLDDKTLGVTPLSVPDIRTGSHPLRIERAGYKTVVTDVVIKSGERARVAVTLELSGVLGPWMPRLR